MGRSNVGGEVSTGDQAWSGEGRLRQLEAENLRLRFRVADLEGQVRRRGGVESALACLHDIKCVDRGYAPEESAFVFILISPLRTAGRKAPCTTGAVRGLAGIIIDSVFMI